MSNQTMNSVLQLKMMIGLEIVVLYFDRGNLKKDVKIR